MSLFNDSPLWCIDIDGSLVEHGSSSIWGERYIKITCPYLGDSIAVRPNLNNVRLVKEKFTQGAFILAWSQGGALWTLAVIKALGLEDYVNLISGKPAGLLDDQSVTEWMPPETCLSNDLKWKN